jgi:hypothetical protein
MRAAESDVATLTAAVEELERECERITTDATSAAQRASDEHAAAQALAAEKAAELAVQFTAERSRADRAEGALGAVTVERDRLLVQLEKRQTPTAD